MVIYLFNDAFSSSDYIASNVGMMVTNEWLNLRYYPSVCLEGLRITMKNLGQDSWSPSRDLNPRPPEYEAGVQTA
jgi:hypothetical protein